MKVRYLVAMTAALAVSASVWADDGAELFKKNGCNACHAVDKKTVGPAVKDIAAKYAGDTGAAAKLEAKVRNGGAGSFGTMPMPPNKKVSDDNLKSVVTWMLSQK